MNLLYHWVKTQVITTQSPISLALFLCFQLSQPPCGSWSPQLASAVGLCTLPSPRYPTANASRSSFRYVMAQQGFSWPPYLNIGMHLGLLYPTLCASSLVLTSSDTIHLMYFINVFTKKLGKGRNLSFVHWQPQLSRILSSLYCKKFYPVLCYSP